MLKRILIVDQNDSNTPLPSLYGKGIDGSQIFTIDFIESLPEPKKRELLTLGEGDGVMLVGGEPFKYLRQFYHYGVRNENYADCSKLYRLSMTGGAYAKCTMEPPTVEEVQQFLSPHFSDHVNFNYQHKVLKTYEEASRFLSWLENLDSDEYFGFDYEASGMPLDQWFELSGASICNAQYGGFLALTDLRENCMQDQYREILRRLGDFLEKRQDHIVVFNMQYEFQVSRRMLGVNLHNLVDAQVINVVDGFHKDKKYSLKWTAQRVLGVQVWDQHFDKLSDLLEEMYFTYEGKTKKDRVKVYKVEKSNFHLSPEFQEISKMFPGYVDEFKKLILTYWGQPFMNIPSDILGYYCNLDSFYTLQMWLKKKPEYSEECWNVFMDNARFGSRLMSGGLYINEPFRLYYKDQCGKMMAWGITYCAMARCMMKMKLNEKAYDKLKKYPKFIQLLLEKDLFKSDKVLEVDIVKNILSKYIDTMDAYELGLDEGALLMDLGEEFAEKFTELLRETMTEIKFKGKIDETVIRKKKLLSVLGSKVAFWIELGKINVTGKQHMELEEYLYYKRAYDELEHVVNTQLNDIRNIPSQLKAFGQVFQSKEYADYVSDSYFKCKSPQENDQIVNEMTEIYKVETTYLASLIESINQLPSATSFYENLGILSPWEGFQHFMKNWENYHETGNLGDYPEKVYTEAARMYEICLKKKPSEEDVIKEVWTDFSGFRIQKQLWGEYTKMTEFYEKPFSESELLTDNFSFIRKFILNYLLFKKYSKVLSTYIEGMFKANNKWVIEESDHIPLREADPSEPGAVEKCFVHYEVNTKSSKRWSSGFHTIVSHSDMKDCICPPPKWNDITENWDFGGSDQLLSYYDISSAEVKSAGFMSMDPELIRMFNEGIDVYVSTAKLYYKDFDTLPKGEQGKKRKQFKTIFLGLLYGLGMKSLASRLNCSEDEAKRIIDAVYQAYPKLREYIGTQQVYPLKNDGYVNTMLGDKLLVPEYKWMLETTSQGEQRNLQARIQRLGVNLPIQGGTASVMASGFFNTYRQSLKEGWVHPLEPYICVHDSSTSAFPVSKIFEIRKFYDTYFTDYCAGIGPKIKLLFDLLEGNSYESACEVKQRSQDTIEFTGNSKTLIPIFDKIMDCKEYVVKPEITMKDGSKQILTREMLIPNYIESPIERFIDQEGTCVVLDKSKYTISFTKIN